MTDDPPQASPNFPLIQKGVKLSLEETTDVAEHINRKAASPDDACPVCASPLNSVTQDVYRLDVFTTDPQVAVELQPVYSTVCMNCGFLRLFNRIVVDREIEAHKQAAAPPLIPGPNHGD